MRKGIEDKVLSGRRLNFKEGAELFYSSDLIWLGLLAHRVRMGKHPERIVTYVVDRNINYTNVCICGCRFCAFHREPGSPEGYLISREELHKKISETLELGGTQILMQGGLNPHLDLGYFVDLFRWIKDNFKIHIHALSPPEIIHICRRSEKTVPEVLDALHRAGLDSIPGGGAEILVDSVRRKVSPLKCSADEWLQVMEAAHVMGIPTTATMMFNHVEDVEDRIAHMMRVRELQDRTGGFTAFIPWTFQHLNTRLQGRISSGIAYLKTLAISRLMIDNVDNLQVSWVTQGARMAQVALSFGANDFGSTMIEENVVAAAGISFRMRVEEIRLCIEGAGFTPRQRDMRYNIIG